MNKQSHSKLIKIIKLGLNFEDTLQGLRVGPIDTKSK